MAGMISAPPMPMTPRAVMSSPAVSVKAAYTLPMPKISRPTKRALALPNRSPSAPIVRSSPANTST